MILILSMCLITGGGTGNAARQPGLQIPLALTQQGRDNLVAYTRLLGYIQHFYPGDEAQNANWPAVAAQGIAEVEEARDSQELAERLQRYFQPLAPTVQVYPTTDRAAVKPLPPGDGTEPRLLRVRHVGVSTEVYNTVSTRERIDLKKESVFQEGMRPTFSTTELTRPWEADLGAGVSCRVPLAVAANALHTLPHTPTTHIPDSTPPSSNALSAANLRAEHLAGVMLVWNAIQHFSPYFDSAPIDWEACLQRSLASAARDDSGEAYLSTLRRLVADLRDGHGSVVWEREAPAYYPAVRWDWVQGQLMVVRVARNAGASLLPGDVIESIDGVPVRFALRYKAPEASGATEALRRRAEMQVVVAGKKDTEVVLGVKSGRGKNRQVVVPRTLDFAAYKSLGSEPRPMPLLQLRPGVWYVDMDRCDPAAFQKALPELANAAGIVFDLRGYPRLSLTAPLEYLTDIPLKTPPILLPVILFPDHKRLRFAPGAGFPVTPQAPRFRGKITFVTDTRAISAAETFLAIIQHYHLGTIVGAPTAGTNGNVRTVPLPGGYTVRFTGLKVLNYDGSRLHGRGIQPDVRVERTRKGILAGQDELLEHALNLVTPG
ncbi:MAG: family peptidase [Chthonomonadales bacterium]|nr:family peptidase [Chthonomonadales bacterium]